MTTHQVNLEYLAEAANLLMGPQGALRLSVVYTTLENVAKRAHEEGSQDGFERGFRTAAEMDRAAYEERRAEEGFVHYYPDVVTLNEAAHGDDDVADIDLHKTHYDTWNGRFHRPGEE